MIQFIIQGTVRMILKNKVKTRFPNVWIEIWIEIFKLSNDAKSYYKDFCLLGQLTNIKY